MQLPERVRVGLYDVKIERQPLNDHHRGQYTFNGAEPMIVVCGQAGVYEAEVMLHELFHTVAHKVGADCDGKDESWCQLFANGVCEIIRANPAFTAWLIDQLGIGPEVAGLLCRQGSSCTHVSRTPTHCPECEVQSDFMPERQPDAPLPGAVVGRSIDPELVALRQRQIEDLDTMERKPGGLISPHWNGAGAPTPKEN